MSGNEWIALKSFPLNSFATVCLQRGGHLVFEEGMNRLVGFGGGGGWRQIAKNTVLTVDCDSQKKRYCVEHNIRGWGVFGRINCAVGVDRDYVVVFGGDDSERNVTNDLFVIKIELDEDTGYPNFINHTDEFVVKTEKPGAMSGCSMTKIGDGEWIVFGDGGLWRLDVDGEEGVVSWEQIEGDHPTKIGKHHGSVFWKGHVVVVGEEVWMFEVEERRWKKMDVEIPVKCNEGLVLLGDLMLGFSSKELGSVSGVDLESGKTVDVDMGNVVVRNSMSVGMNCDNQIVLFGGTIEDKGTTQQQMVEVRMFPWTRENHWMHPKRFKRRVMEMLLMWNHDQYDPGECDGIRWNELPIEVVERVIRWVAISER